MDATQKKCYDAAHDGFYLSGNYDVIFGNHRKTISADSVRWLAKDIHSWFSKHLEHCADNHIVVRFVSA
jgi:hypothetical protein